MRVIHVGVDLHKRTSQVAVLTDEGELKQRRLENELAQVRQFLEEIPAPASVAIEASSTWWWLVDLLDKLGHHPFLSHPKQTKAIAAARLKNDRVDAERLVLLLRADLLPMVWIPSVALREARELLRHRISLVWVRTRIKNRLLALLARCNAHPTVAKSWLNVRGQRALQALPLAPVPATLREDCLELIHLLDEQVRRTDQQLLRCWGKDPRVQRLMTIPGIGPSTAILLVLELGDIHRFASAKHLASYIGLTPRIHASANRTRGGHISMEQPEITP